MKILSAAQIREADAYTIQYEPILSIDLMERAATACVDWLLLHLDYGQAMYIFCGLGNNGGDGLAIARMLSLCGVSITVCIVRLGENSSTDFQINLARLQEYANIQIIEIEEISHFPTLAKNCLIVDAIFGTGLNKSVTGLAAEVIQTINQSEEKVISIDIPSGLFADKATNLSENAVIRAATTLSFECYKLAFMFAENAESVGEIVVLPIALHPTFMHNCETSWEVLDKEKIQKLLQKRSAFSHKGTYGHAAIVAGSYGKIGAATLAARACLRTGAGLLTVYAPKCAYNILQVAIPEAMIICDEHETQIEQAFSLGNYTSIGIGPGIGTSESSTKAVLTMIQQAQKPMVIDADALNILASHKESLQNIPPQSILTPHPKEFERLVGTSTHHFERNQLQIAFSQKYQVFVVLKGRFTCISTPDGNCYFNPTGNPGMAKGGSGDTLTGILTSLLAQGYSPLNTCLLGVYLHGLAADIAAQKVGERALLASDLIENIGAAYGEIEA